MKALKVILIIFGFFVVIAGGPILKTYRDAGEFKKLNPHYDGKCVTVPGVQSSEDITVHPRTGVAFISSDDRRAWFGGSSGRQGAIYAFNLTYHYPKPENLTADLDLEFHPHGLGLYAANDGSTSLFVVNHRMVGHFIEIFDYREGKLFHRKSISGPPMHSPNDVLPVGPNQFYVTNDHGSRSRKGRMLEDYLQLKRSYVLFYDGHDFRVVAKDLGYANGINMSHDGETIYVAATVHKKLFVYDRDKSSETLTLRYDIDLGTGVDNIEVDEMGDLWIGAHPKLLTFVKYANDPQRLSPSQVLWVSLNGEGEHKVEEVFLSNGRDLSGSSVAAVYRGLMLIGSVFDDRFLMCKLPQES